MNSSFFRAVSLGAVLGFTLAVVPGCGPTTVTRCSASNCDGCCDDTGVCRDGLSLEACGSIGALCSPCQGAGITCQSIGAANGLGGQCANTGTGGGAGGGSGGGTGGGTAGGTGGGSGDGGTGTCNASNCATGCCTQGGSCITTTTSARCGSGGNACAPCASGNSCVAGACTPCTGCVDLQTGQCNAGTDNASCGRMGNFCQRCDTNLSQMCTNGACQGGANCNATTCPDGCCDGNDCVAKSMMANARCGVGVGGAACTACSVSQGETCELDAGACARGAATDGGIFPGFDAGFPDLCTLLNGMPCGANKCCGVDSFLGILPTCVNNGALCGPAGSKTCNGAAMACQ